MFEAFFLVALVVVVLLALRGKKAVVFDNPVIIHKVGFYHATLSPQLGCAQDFIERITGQLAESGLKTGELATQYFEVRDAGVVEGSYLLAVGLRAGMLYFQGILPELHAAASRYTSIHKFSGQVMAHHPLLALPDVQGALCLRAAVEAAAKQLQISCLSLQEIDQ